MTDNPFANIGDYGAAPTDKPQMAQPGGDENPFAQIGDYRPSHDTSFMGALGVGALSGAAPAAGGLAGAGYGAAVGSALGPFGSFVGGALGAFAGGYGAGKAQDFAISELPHSWQDPITEYQRSAEEQHPTASFLGGMVPMALTMSPNLSMAAGKPAPDATMWARIAAHPVAGRLFGGAVQGAFQLGQDEYSEGKPNWTHVGWSTAFGMVFNRANHLIGEPIERAGAEEAYRQGIKRPSPPEVAPTPTDNLEAGIAAIAREPNAETPPRDIAKEIWGETPPPAAREPTVLDAQDLKVAGVGIDENVFQGSRKRDEAAEMSARDAKRTETLLTEPEPVHEPDVTGLVARMEPELLKEHDALIHQRDSLANLAAEQGPDSPAAKHLAEVDKAIDETTPQVKAAYEAAAERAGGEVHDPASGEVVMTSGYEGPHDDAIQNRIDYLRSRIESPDLSNSDKMQLANRISDFESFIKLRNAALETENVPPDLQAKIRGLHPDDIVQTRDGKRLKINGWGKDGHIGATDADGLYRNISPADIVQTFSGYRKSTKAVVVGEGGSAGAIPPEPPTPPAAGRQDAGRDQDFTSDEQRQWVIDDLTRRWIAAGRPADEAHASARVVAEGYEQWARRTGGKFGGTAEMYVKEHPAIVGVDGKTIPPGLPPVGRTVVAEPAVTPLPPENPKTAPKTRRRTPPAQAPAVDEGSHFAAGRAAARAGQPRQLPDYFTDKTGKNARDWLRGWDRTPPAEVKPAEPAQPGAEAPAAPVEQPAAPPPASAHPVEAVNPIHLRGGWTQLDDDDRELLHDRLTRILEKRGELKPSDIPVDLSNKIDTASWSIIRDALARDPKAALDTLMPSRPGEPPMREPTDVEKEWAALDAKDRQIESEKNSPQAIAEARKMADEAGVSDDIGDMIALWRDPEEAASALWARDKFWADHAAFEWTDEKTFSRFVEQVARSLGAPIDNPGEMERWSTNWFARTEPDLFAKGEGEDTAARVAAAHIIPNWPDYKVAYVDAAKVEAMWARDHLYVGEGGRKGMEDRYKAAQAFIRDLRPGEDLKAPAVDVVERGVSFADGRHRFAAMRDAGLTEIPVSLNAESLKNARRLGLLTRDVAEEAPAAASPAERAPEPAPAPAPEQPKPAYGAGNKLITADRAAAVRERLKQKLKDAASTTSSGIDPEFLQLGTELAAFHLEAGARKFADFAKAISDDLGAKLEQLRPYLRSWYNGARDMMEDHGLDVTGIDPPDVVRTELDSLLREESVNAGPAIHEDGAEPLEKVAPAENQGTPGGGNAERAGAASEPRGVGSSGQSDAGRVATARGGRKGSARSDNASPRAGRVKRAQAIAEEVDAKNPAFSESPSVTERETANVNIPNTDFVLTDELAIGKGTEGEKYADNLAAIRTLKRIEAENRRATPEEKAVLARYVGWGGLKNAFRVAGAAEGEGIAKGWEKRVAELEGLLTPQELRRARNSTTAAHYTSPTVVKAIWQAVDRLGFAGGSVLEPSVGVGNFIGFMPEAARGKSNVFAVEYDSLTARIAQKLYPQADIVQAGFQDVPLPENQFALAIGNPPFGSEKLFFRFNPAVNGKTIHNQFFLNSMRGVRPGGLLAMVVSHNLMDALDNSARLDLARQGKFLGAIRLPDTAFKENARTEVVTDVIFLRKHEAGDEEWAGHAADSLAGLLKPDNDLAKDVRVLRHKLDMRPWIESNEINDPAGSGEKINANNYFIDNPDMVVGRINATGKMNRRAELNVQLDRPEEFQPRLNAALAKLPKLSPNEDVAASSLAHYKKMAQGMKLSVERAEPGRIRVDEDGNMKTVIDIDAGEGQAKSVLQEVELTPDTPFKNAYSLNIDGKWQKTADVLDEKGNPKKIMKQGVAKDAQGNDVKVLIPTNRNEKQTVVYDNLKDIPERDKWGERNVAAVRAMLKIRDAFKAQLQHEMQDSPKEMIEANRAKLNEAYDAFTKEYGTLNDRKNAKLAYSMPDGGLIMAAEDVDKKGKVSKSAIMSRRVTEPPKVIERAANIGDAVGISLGETGKIDVERIAKLLGTDEAGAIKALSEGEKPRAFFDPETQRWEAADQYLSGLVKKKLLAAKEHGLEANIAALEKVIPADWDASQITPNLGSPWIPPSIISDFLKYIGYDEAFVDYSPVTNSFSVGFKGAPRAEWETGSGGHSPGTLVSKLLNSQPLKVVHTDSEGKTYVDEEATAASQAKGKELFNEFLDWAYKDDDRRQTLVRVFNDKFNTRVVGQRDGSHLTLPGKVPDVGGIKMRRHQNNAIWRGITDRAVLYDHAVGAGKTFTAIARVMERRRMGLSRKPLIVVPNHLVEQWGADITRLYPGANALVAGAEDFKRENRRQLFARIAAGDYDMTVIGHSSFGFIDIDPSTEERYLTEELISARAAIVEAQKAADESGFQGFGKPLGVKEAERLVTNTETRLAKIRDAKRDRLLTFEEMGIDDLTVDESHEFKNLAYSSRLQGVSGMGNKAGSGKAMDLNMKVRSLHDRQGTSVAFMTGTPISNSVSEMYLILKNLVPNELKELGIDNFDAWRSMYVDYSSAYEPTEAGGIKEVTRLGRDWTNMKSLMDLYYSVADAVPTSDIETAFKEDNPGREFPIPKVRSKVEGGGDRQMVAVKPTPEQEEILRDVIAGFQALPGLDLKERNIERLKLMDRARKVSLDARAVDPKIKVANEGGKISAIVDNVARIYDKSRDDKGTQIIFLDRSVPKAKGDEKIIAAYDDLHRRLREAVEANDTAGEQKIVEALEKYNANEVEAMRAAQSGGWNAYDEIKRQLVAKGIPENEIRFVQEANNDEQKRELFDSVNEGQTRVIIGSTPRMGAGTNVQKRLVALHHADVTWKPSDIEQREGRIVRQGNIFVDPLMPDGLSPNPNYRPGFAVDVMAYATERTVDAKMWSLNATKLKAINGIRKYDGSFNMEFEDEESASMAEMAALATGNPLMVERVTLGGQIGKLELAQRSFNRRQGAMRDQLVAARREVDTAPTKAADYRAFADTLEQSLSGVKERSAARSVTVDGKAYNSTPEALAAANQRIEEIKAGDERARFSLEVGGQKFTTKDDVIGAIRKTLGTENFETEIGGEKFIRPWEAAQAIERAMQGKGTDFTLDGIKLNGVPVEVDVTPYSTSGGVTKQYQVSYSALNAKGQEMAGYRTLLSDTPKATAISAGLEKIVEKLKPESYRQSAESFLRKAAEAEKKMPDLVREVDKLWPAADELAQKRARLQEVIGELSGTKDGKALDAALKGEGEPEDAEALAQRGAGDVKQGSLDVKPGGQNIMRLFADANASTIMHETAHDWLEKLKRYSAFEEATDDLKADWKIVKNWLGVKEDGKISRKQHERFARGFEQYLREGVAPSIRLAGVFAQFKSWLMAIYQSAKSLGRPINDDVRGVFDRMLAEHPQKTVIADERGGPSLATIHEHDADETPPQHAEQVRDQIAAERDQAAANHPPEIVSELTKGLAEVEAAQQQQAAEGAEPEAGPAGPSASEPTGEAGAGPSGYGQVEGGSGAAEPVGPGGGGGERSGEVERGGGEAVAEGNGRAAGNRRPVSGRDAGPPVPKPVEQFTAESTDEFAGNIRVRNVSDEAGVWKLLKDVSENNGDFMGDRNAPQSWGQTVDLADGLGMTVDDLLDRKRGQAFNAAQAWAALQILKTSAHDVWTLAKAVEQTGTDEAALAYAEAMSRHGLIQAQFAGITSEAGRTLNIYRAMKAAGEGKLNAINEASKGEASRTLYQIKKEAKLIAQLDDTHKIGKIANDKNKAGFWDHVLEYWINGLISGPTTHVTYSIGNLALATWKAGPETVLAGVIGNLQKAEGSRVHVAESRAQFAGARRGLAPAVANAVQSFREGATLRLPGDKGFDAVMTQTGGMANVDATWKDAAAQTFGLARGLRDAFMGGAALLKAGGIEGEPAWGLRRAGGINPDITIKGVGALPLGTLIRLPSRMVASLHTFFRVLNYSMEKSALAMRQAIEEGHEGEALAARAGELWQNPTEGMMASAAHTATEMTLMSTEGEFTRKLAELTNAKFPILNMRLLKFIAPFVRISSNVIDQSILQRTPVGFLSESIRNDVMGKTGISSEDYAKGVRNNVAQAKAMSRMIAGSATAMLFGSLAASGYISGSGPMDRRKAATWRLAGNQAHSVRIGDMWYDMHRLGPLGLLMSTAADMQDVVHNLEQGDALAAGNALWYGITQNILDESFMRGPADLIKAVEDPGRYGEGYIKQTIASFLPYSVGMAQMARASDPYARQARTVMDEIKRRIPGESENLLPRRDVWGNPIPNPSAFIGAGVTSLYETAVSQDPVNQAMWNVGVFPATLKRTIRNIQLTDEQYDQFQVLAGAMAKMRLDAIVRSPQFRTFPPNIQHDVMAETISQSREVARGVMMGRFPEIMRDATQAKMKKATGLK